MSDREVVAECRSRFEDGVECVEHFRITVVRNVVWLGNTLTVGVELESGRGRRIQLERGRRIQPDLLGQVALSVFVTESEVGLPFGEVRAALCEDLDDAVGRVRSIQRTRRGTLDDFDVIDVFGVDVGEAEPRDRTVNDDERILASGERGGGAEANGRLSTGRAGVDGHTGTGNFSAEAAQRRGSRRVSDGAGVNDTDSKGRLLLRRRVGDARDDDLIQTENVLVEVVILVDATRGDDDRQPLRLEPDVAHDEVDVSSAVLGHIHRKAVFAIDGGDCAGTNFRNTNARAADRLTG